MEFLAEVINSNQYQPLGAEAFKKALKLQKGDCIKIEKWILRNVQFHRKFFAFLNTVIYFLPEDKKYDNIRNIDYLREELMIMIGEVDVHVTFDGIQHLKAKSISFRSMDNEKFERVYSLCIDAALKYLLHDISKENFEKYLLNFL